MNTSRDKLWLVITTAFAVIITICTLSHMATDPSHMIPDLGGDGAKNMFTYLYHSIYGTGYWFTGMNYPYGEHIVYTDGQPLLSVAQAAIGGATTSSALGILWTLISISYVLCIIYCYKTLRAFKVSPIPAMIFAALITICSPQLIRLRGHYALSYACVIPMLFYWTLLYRERTKNQYAVYMFLLGCTMAFLHPYFVGLLLVWAGLYAAGAFLFSNDTARQKIKHIAPPLTAAILVAAVVAITMKLTDPVKDRPKTPYIDAYELFTRPRHVFSSYISPIWLFIKDHHLIARVSEGGEGYTYPGMVTLLTVFIICCVLAFRVLKTRTLRNVFANDVMSPIWLFMAFAALLFSMGFPFSLHMKSINYFFLFKQFRSLGRFSWIFYYIATICTAAFIWHYIESWASKKRYAFAVPLAFLVLLTWGIEANAYLQMNRNVANEGRYNYGVFFSKHEKNWQTFLQENGRKPSDFQAILMLPFYHIGTEKVWLNNKVTEWLVSLGARAGLQLHLPIIDVMMSRSSWSVAAKQLKIAGGPYATKDMLLELKSDKPFLLMHFEEDSLNDDQKYLLTASDYIGHHTQCNVYACYPSRILANDKRVRDSIAAITPALKEGDTWSQSTPSGYVDHFDNGGCSDAFLGKGSELPISTDSSLIATIPVTGFTDSAYYEMSCWFLLGTEDYRSPYITVRQFDANGKELKAYDVLANKSTDSKGMWYRAGRYFYLKPGCTTLKCYLQNLPNPSYKAMDELLLRPASTTVISKGKDGHILVNNHILR